MHLPAVLTHSAISPVDAEPTYDFILKRRNNLAHAVSHICIGLAGKQPTWLEQPRGEGTSARRLLGPTPRRCAGRKTSKQNVCQAAGSDGWPLRRSTWVPPILISPEVLEPVRRQRRVDGGAGDRPMSEPALDRAGIVAAAGAGLEWVVRHHHRRLARRHRHRRLASESSPNDLSTQPRLSCTSHSLPVSSASGI
jgi:hypothetical protein